jgi:hypothetical protein
MIAYILYSAIDWRSVCDVLEQCGHAANETARTLAKDRHALDEVAVHKLRNVELHVRGQPREHGALVDALAGARSQQREVERGAFA